MDTIENLKKAFKTTEYTLSEVEAILKYEIDLLIKEKETKYQNQCNFELSAKAARIGSRYRYLK